MNYISKDYFIQYNIGKVKYCLSYFIGNRYEDGSKRYEIKTFKSKKALNSFIKTGEKQTSPLIEAFLCLSLA